MLRQINISNAFLHDTLEEQNIISQLYGFVDDWVPDQVCLLHKSLYGLKKLSRCWFQRLSGFLLTLKFKESAIDPSLFIYYQHSITVFLFVYVNDIVIVGSDEEQVKKLIQRLATEFPIRDLGDLEFFLGVQVNRFKEGLHLS